MKWGNLQQRLLNLEQLVFRRAADRYNKRYVLGIDSPRLNNLWEKLKKGEIKKPEEEELYRLLFS